MNLTETTLPEIGRRLNWQAVTLVGGLVLAVGAAIGLGALESETDLANGNTTPSAGGQPAQDIPSPRGAATSPSSARPVVVIVQSQEQADALAAQMASDERTVALEGGEMRIQPTSFVVIDSAEDEEFLRNAITGQLAADSFDIVDLRSRALGAGKFGGASGTLLPEGALDADFGLPTTFAVEAVYPSEGAIEADFSLATTFAAEASR
jgi:hypothetical protein